MILGFILILIVIVPYTIYLYIMNKRLQQKIETLELENKKILERNVLNIARDDIQSITNLSSEIKPNVVSSIEVQEITPENSNQKEEEIKQKEENKDEEEIEKTEVKHTENTEETVDEKIKISKEIQTPSKNEKKEIMHNKIPKESVIKLQMEKERLQEIKQELIENKILEQIKSNLVTTNSALNLEKNVANFIQNADIQPIKIESNSTKYPYQNNKVDEKIEAEKEEDNFNLYEFINESKKENIDINLSESKKYLEELSDKFKNSTSTKAIELTDYEKEQEEHAIISYQELKSRDQNEKNNNLEETEQFIENLKDLRNNLNPKE